MDDAIFVDLVNALANCEKEDKEKEAPKKVKESLKEKENNKSDDKEKGDEQSQKNYPSSVPFPSMQVFYVSSKQKEKSYALFQSIFNLFSYFLTGNSQYVSR